MSSEKDTAFPIPKTANQTDEILFGEPAITPRLAFDQAALIQKVGDFAHSVFIGKYSGSLYSKAGIITKQLFEDYFEALSANRPAGLQSEIDGYFNLAKRLIKRSGLDSQTEIGIAIVDEGLEDVESISPIGIAKTVRRRERQHSDILKPMELTTQLWTLERHTNRDEIVTGHLKALLRGDK